MQTVPTNKRESFSGLWLIGVSLALYLISFFAFGFHFGWLDDVLVYHVMHGTFSGRPTFNFFENFRLVGHAISWFYGLSATINWMGVLLYGLSFLSTVTILKIVVDSLRNAEIRLHISILIGILFYSAFLLENVVFINYTRVAILSMGAGLLLMLYMLQNYTGVKGFVLAVAGLFLFSVGYLIRPEVALFPLSVFGVLAVIVAVGKKVVWSKFLAYSLAILMTVAVVKIDDHYDNLPTYEEFKKYRPHITKLLDANYVLDRREMNLTQEDEVRLNAVGLWYYMDKQQVGIQYLDSLTQGVRWELPPLKRWSERITTQWKHAQRYTKAYHWGYNYHFKIIGYVAFNIVLMFIWGIQLLKKQISVQTYLLKSFYTSLFLALVLGVLVVFKMEDRVLSPFFIIHLLGYLLLDGVISSAMVAKKAGQSIVLLALVTVSVFGTKRVYGLSQEKKAEVENQQRLMEELNSKFHDKIILYDIWTIGYIHGNPFSVPPLDTSRNVHFAFGEYFMSPSANYSAKAKRICRSDSHSEFFDCLCERKTDVIFFHSQIRILLLEEYFSKLYGKRLIFKKMKEPTVLDSMPYSFLWDSISPGYYQLIECEGS